MDLNFQTHLLLRSGSMSSRLNLRYLTVWLMEQCTVMTQTSSLPFFFFKLGYSRLRDSTFTFHFHALVNKMAAHSSVLAWRIPGTAEPGGLPSMGSHRVRHDRSDLAAAAGA